MDILVIAEKKTKAAPYVDALIEKGAHAEYLRVSKITLVSRQNETLIKALGKELHSYDAIFIQVRPSLAPFIEPLLEEIKNLGTYCTAKKGSYYIAHNEPYQLVTLACAQVPTPKTLTSGSAKHIEKVSKKVSYPLLAKSFIGKKAQQAIIVNSSRELNFFIKSIKTEIDGFMLREFIRADAISCIVIGRKIFAVKRKHYDGNVNELIQGTIYKPTETEEKNATCAAHACGLDIARVDLVKGKVVKVEPLIPLEEFNQICSEEIQASVASFLLDKAAQHEGKKKTTYDFFGIKKLLSKTIFGRFFK
ncbi:MAG: hypothetical protein WC821_04805 [archaeon]|jgi:glutathione synthase/RimK-type ligase-like ATP-grasp enzyme